MYNRTCKLYSHLSHFQRIRTSDWIIREHDDRVNLFENFKENNQGYWFGLIKAKNCLRAVNFDGGKSFCLLC